MDRVYIRSPSTWIEPGVQRFNRVSEDGLLAARSSAKQPEPYPGVESVDVVSNPDRYLVTLLRTLDYSKVGLSICGHSRSGIRPPFQVAQRGAYKQS